MSLLHLKIEPTLNASTRKVIIIWYIPKIGYFYMQFSDLSLWWMNGRKLGSIHNLLEKITSIERIIGREGMMFMNTYMYTNTVFSNVVIFAYTPEPWYSERARQTPFVHYIKSFTISRHSKKWNFQVFTIYIPPPLF